MFSSGGGASGSGGLDSERAVDQENQGEETQPKQLLREDNAQGAQLGSSFGRRGGGCKYQRKQRNCLSVCPHCVSISFFF